MGLSGSVLLPKVMSAHGLTVDRVCGNVCGLCCYRRPCSYSWPGLLPKVILMFTGPAVRGHVGVSSPGCLLEPCFYLWALLPPGVRWRWVACVFCWGDVEGGTTEAYDGICDLCSSSGPCWYPWSLLPLETTLRSLAHADTLNNKKDTKKED